VFGIGEFSRITGLTVKALRFYHEQGLLVPSYVNPATGYRSYNAADAERARVIRQLKEFQFPLEQIRRILEECRDETDVVGWLERQRRTLAERLDRDRALVASLDRIIAEERKAIDMTRQATLEIEEKDLPGLLVAAIRMRGRYSDCGKGFARLGRALGRLIAGRALCLYYDGEYKEDNADFEPCFPVRQKKEIEGISFHELPGGRCVSLVHQGPYEQLGRSYEKILAYVQQKGYALVLPTREVYIKGPGMIFRGNPKNYLTEIQIPIKA
jgi:DNA-binding transcriptional MerR regulator/predicted transcriptional regulator YdeE